MKKILVIDDDTDILELMSTMLRMYDYEVHTSPHWELVRTFIGEYHPDLLLLDVSLNGADGRKICHDLKADPTVQQMPIVLFSADPEMGRDLKTSGANEFMPKPFDLSTLISTIERQFEKGPEEPVH
jgi:CheY-like chemotaxis protein